MALFKIYRGTANNLSNAPKQDGYAYYTTDDSKMYIGVTNNTDSNTIDLVPLNGTFYGTCSSEASTVTKTVVCDNFDKLLAGVTIHIYFTYNNTAANPKLKVGNSAATAIAIGSQTWKSGTIVAFTYNGSNWVMNSGTPTISPTIIKTWTET